MHIIGIGTGGSNIARNFAKYEPYTIHTIDVKDADIIVPQAYSMEEAEGNIPDLSGLSEKIKKEEKIIFIICGGGNLSGASLAIMEQMKENPLTVIYVRPDKSLINHKSFIKERVVYRVLQEYARSGVFEKLYLFANSEVAAVVEKITLENYYEKINDLIVNTVHTINFLKNNNAIMSNVGEMCKSCRIATFGLYNMESTKEKKLFNIEKEVEKVFYFVLSKKTLQTEDGMIQLLSDKLKKAKTSELVNVMHSIFSLDYENDFVYIEYNTKLIQE
jgi:hypothetical protein